MRGLVIDRFGGPEVYRIATDLEVPEPGPGEVQIKVQGSSINPVDFKIREGLAKPFLPEKLPAVTLRDLSGIITKVGEGVTSFQVDDCVFGITATGAAADCAIAKATDIALRPPSMDCADAAVVPLAGMTAWQALFDHGQVKAGQRVLIHAAAGGVGTFAVQLAKWKGAHVIGTASKNHFSVLRELGADELIDYKEEKFEDKLSDLDFVLHSIGQDQLENSLKVLKKGGRLIAISAAIDEAAAQAQGKTAVSFMMQPNSDQLRQLSNLIEDLKVRPVIDTVVNLEKAVEAMKELEAGHVLGKLGVRIGSA